MTMEASSAVVEDPHYTLENINSSHSYSTDAQSVQSGVTHGTAPSAAQSPARTATTPLSLSPSSHTIKSNQKIKEATVLPQISDRSHDQGDVQLSAMEQEWEALEQQQMLESALSRQRTNPASDDDETEPSSSANTRENNELTFNNENNTDTKGYTRSDSNTGATSTFGRLVKSAAKSINNRTPATNTGRKESADEVGVIEGVLIYGYLQKLNRNGKWQTRWFETDGECLTYFKSSKRVKLLASLDLAKVGSIVVNNEYEDGCCFTIHIAKRPYHLRADSKTAMKDWVITLNRVKEARLQEGNVKLFMPNDFQKNQHPIDLLDDNFNTPRVVVVANRQRTHAVEDEDFHSWEANVGNGNNAGEKEVGATASIARWQKPRTSIRDLASKMLRWARSIKKYHCSSDAVNQVMPSTVAPTQSASTAQSPKDVVVPIADLLGSTGGVESAQARNPNTNAIAAENDDDENGARFLS